MDAEERLQTGAKRDSMQLPAGAMRSITTFAVVLATLGGRVLDATTNQPLPHVRVRVGGVQATTDVRGRFTLRGVRPGSVNVSLESDDVPLQHVTVRLGPGATHRDLHACSTTLDFHCGARSPNAPSGPDGAG